MVEAWAWWKANHAHLGNFFGGASKPDGETGTGLKHTTSEGLIPVETNWTAGQTSHWVLKLLWEIPWKNIARLLQPVLLYRVYRRVIYFVNIFSLLFLWNENIFSIEKMVLREFQTLSNVCMRSRMIPKISRMIATTHIMMTPNVIGNTLLSPLTGSGPSWVLEH